jgi:hypothetical protein
MLDGVLKSVPASVRDNSTCIFPQKIILLKLHEVAAIFYIFHQRLTLCFGIKI